MTSLLAAPAGRPACSRRRAWALIALTLGWWMLCCTSPALATAPSGLLVTPISAAGPARDYFKLRIPPGQSGRAGTIELRNPTGKTLRVALAPVDGQTLDTLGSAYAPAGSPAHGSTRWLRVGSANVTLAPGGRALVPISITVPGTAQPGDYLSGVSIEALDQRPQHTARGRVSIASVDRYAIGVEVSLPGARHPAIEFTGASLAREPSGLTFLLAARNSGNAILQGVHGWVRVTRAGHTVLSRPIETGTFVTASNIAYPVPAFGETPTEGTRYAISAWMRYPGGIARLNTTVSFGHREAVVQQQYGGPPATQNGTAWWKIALAAGAILYGLFTTILLLLLLRRRRERPARNP
ncbi:MAG TPA: hypothetical protein VFV03_03050 [Solirubrobacteraceae bacterium]|nr:hypothetical protein [Solirubrobacteraceae bacterium]